MTCVVTAVVGMKETTAGVQSEAGAVVMQFRVMDELNPEMGVVVRVVVVGLPAMTWPEVGLMLKEKSTPVPVRARVSPEKARLEEFTLHVPL
jgi:hypothetical protein